MLSKNTRVTSNGMECDKECSDLDVIQYMQTSSEYVNRTIFKEPTFGPYRYHSSPMLELVDTRDPSHIMKKQVLEYFSYSSCGPAYMQGKAGATPYSHGMSSVLVLLTV